MIYFSDTELMCRCGCGKSDMDTSFMGKLNLLRKEYGKPIYLTSAFRCDEHNAAIGGGYAHPSGRAVDINILGEDALKIICLAKSIGFTGFGVSQKGNARFIHLDTIEPGEFTSSPRPWLWSY